MTHQCDRTKHLRWDLMRVLSIALGGLFLSACLSGPGSVETPHTTEVQDKESVIAVPLEGEACGQGMVEDCAHQCVKLETAQLWIGDGFCDDGSFGMVLTCPEFDNDADDCVPCSADEDCEASQACIHDLCQQQPDGLPASNAPESSCANPSPDGSGLSVPSVTVSTSTYQPLEELVVSYCGAQSATDWIGLFPAGSPEIDSSGAYTWIQWTYLVGSAASASSGTVRFDGLSETGSYEVRMFANDSLDRVASASFAVVP